MFDAIESDPDLFAVCGQSCEENGVKVELCDALLEDGAVNDGLAKIIKVDLYYANLHAKVIPKSIDCLIVVGCTDGSYNLTLAELRNVSGLKGQRSSVFLEKFRNTFSDFMQTRFPNLFASDAYKISSINAWLVIDPFRSSNLTDEEYNRKLRGTMLELFQFQKPFKVGKHTVLIRPKRPNPVVCTCP